MVPSLHFRRTPENDGTGQKEGCVREKEKERRGRGSGVLFLPGLSRGVQSTFPENPLETMGLMGVRTRKLPVKTRGQMGVRTRKPPVKTTVHMGLRPTITDWCQPVEEPRLG